MNCPSLLKLSELSNQEGTPEPPPDNTLRAALRLWDESEYTEKHYITCKDYQAHIAVIR